MSQEQPKQHKTKGCWHQHPPPDFVAWWVTQRDYGQGIDAKRAYNCQRYRQDYLGVKETGLH